MDFLDKLSSSGKRINRCTEIIDDLTKKMSEVTLGLTDDTSPVERKRIADQLAIYFKESSRSLDDIFAGADVELQDGIEAVRLFMHEHSKNGSLEEEELVGMIEQMSETVFQMNEFLTAIQTAMSSTASGPNLSSKIESIHAYVW